MARLDGYIQEIQRRQHPGRYADQHGQSPARNPARTDYSGSDRTGSWVRASVAKRLSPFIYLLYPVPHVVLLPLVIILFGIGDFSKIFLIGLIVFFQILVTTRDGAKNIHRNYFYSMQTLGASRLQIYRHVILPATLPKILTALRISIGTAIAILFFVESFATTKGLGYIIMDSWGRADYISLYTGISCMGILGFILYLVLDRLEQHVCRWISTG